MGDKHFRLYGTLLLVGYLVLIWLTIRAAVWWARRPKPPRDPLPEDIKRLRLPGEFVYELFLQRGVKRAYREWYIITFGPLDIGHILYHIAVNRPPSMWGAGVLLATMVILLLLVFSVTWNACQLRPREDCDPEASAKREVAEFLDRLKAGGWFIFHDVPFDRPTGKFSLDHVAVGPGGVWVVKTATRRKVETKRKAKGHSVIFDGNQILCPWGKESDSLQQAADDAHWLSEWIKERIGKQVDVGAVLTFPGYSVVEQKPGPVRVASPKTLPDVLMSRGKSVLQEEDIDLIQRLLEDQSRNVEY
jgi:hypothetical protein